MSIKAGPPISGAFVPSSGIGDELASALSDAIVFLRLAPGLRLTEEDLCARYGVSRSPVREALRLLEADGLITRIARRGVRIAPMSQNDLREVYTCRSALEAVAASEAARRADRATITSLEVSLGEMEAALRNGEIEGFFSHNVAFTRGIHLASGNITLQRLLSGIEKQSVRYRYMAHLRSRDMLTLSYQGQHALLVSIRDRSPARAKGTAIRVIRQAHAEISKVLSDSNLEDISASLSGVAQTTVPE